MAIYIGLAIGLIIAGLVIIMLSPKAGNPALATVFWWVGLVLAIFGLVLILDPVIHYLANQVRAMIAS